MSLIKWFKNKWHMISLHMHKRKRLAELRKSKDYIYK